MDIHQQGIVHKDLKPENILVNRTTGEVKITDFGLASRIPREQPTAGPPRLIEGSLPYLSPEQTGRTNRAIDGRADLYSLGVTFYQMLTGQLPFEAHDPVEWVHCHVARAPPSPREVVPEVPETIARIVLKLLSKMPEDRYQSARGLRLDLERCLAQWSRSGRIEPFAPGERDVSDRLQIPQKLYGREAEIDLLLQAFGRAVAAGAAELLLVSGYSGIGKSALVHELHKSIVRERAFFLAGKFDQYKRDIPYATLVQAFRELVLEILTESEPRIAAWRQRLLGALGINAQLIVDVIPQVELVIGRQRPVPELPPAEAQNRFRTVLRHFIGVFAEKEHPLVLFLDDLQWADSASLGLVKELVAHSEMRHLLIVGAYRDNEVTPSHPLMLTLDDARKAGARVSSIVLGPIPPEHLAAFIRDALHCRRDEAAPLSDLVNEKTAGNPFFAIQFLTTLYEERLIEFDGRVGAFRWDIARIRAENFTDNVVDLMVGKLRRLPATTQEALKQLACLGNNAEVALLTMVRGGSEQDTHADLWEAIRAGLIRRLDGTYKFLHDRIHEAAYSLIPEELRAAAHLGIGRLLVARLSPEEVEERVFDIVSQWNRGADLITDPDEKQALSRLDALAGAKAKAATAYASARSYLAQASSLLAPDAWSTRYEETFTLSMEFAECESLVGNFQRADALFDLILQNARSSSDRTRAYRLRMRLYQMAGRHKDAVTVMLEAVRLFGVTIPESDEEIQAAAEAEIRQVPINLRGRRVADLVDAPVATDESVRALIGLIAESAPLVYTTRPALWPLITVKGVNLSLQRGHAEESSFVYSCYAMVLVSVTGDIPRALQFSEMAIRLNEKRDNAALKGKLLFHHAAVITVWCRHFATSLPLMEQAFLDCLDVGDLVCAGYFTYNMVWLHLESGDPLDHVIDVARKYTAFAGQNHNDVVYHVVRIEEQFAASLKGATRASTSFDDGAFDEASAVAALAEAGFGLGIAYYHIMKQIAAFTHERYAEALQSAASAALVLREVASMANEATHHFYHALTLAALYAQAPAEQQRRFAQTLEEQLRKMKLWADNCPENFGNRHSLVSAEVARIEGRELDAERLYEEAIRSARENGFVHNEALAYELASRFYRARGFARFADAYLCDARACYARWGADGKVKQIDQQNPRLFEPRSLAPTATFAVRTEQIDLLSVIKASQTISGEIVLDDLVRTLLVVVLEQGGAQRAYLILRRDESLSIEAEATIEEKGVATSILGSEPVESSARIPLSLVHYVLRTKERVILAHAAADAGKFAGDDYFARSRPRSVLCMPILRQAEVVGLLYLENNLLVGAFTPDRLVALEILATQAAISLENAVLLAKERAARAAAQKAVRARDEFFTVASHELHTPVTSLSLAVQSMRRAAPSAWLVDPQAMGRSLELASRQAARLTRLTNDLLDVSRMDADRLLLELTDVDLGALVREVVERFELDLVRSRCAIVIQVGSPVVGRWDRCRVDQVITNLLSNAIKFGAGKPIELFFGAERGAARLTVRDHGIGIAPAQQGRIFGRFERAVSDQHYGGLGLGLYISQKIVEAHGGSIRVHSEPGAGATFTIELPVAGPPASADRAAGGMAILSNKKCLAGGNA
jgi:predicted ATPase/signal transduction histidine kinase